MSSELERLKSKHRRGKKESNFKFNKVIVKLIITIVLTIVSLIILKTSTTFKTGFYKYVYDSNISFASINNLYQKYFGSPLPFKDWFDYTKPVFNEQLTYKSSEDYKEGVKLDVDTNYLVPLLESGIVIFVGEKEEYGNTVIVQQANGIDVWYSNLGEINVKLYDYLEKGSLLGETFENNLYLVFIKDGEVLDYKKYI